MFIYFKGTRDIVLGLILGQKITSVLLTVTLKKKVRKQCSLFNWEQERETELLKGSTLRDGGESGVCKSADLPVFLFQSGTTITTGKVNVNAMFRTSIEEGKMLDDYNTVQLQ